MVTEDGLRGLGDGYLLEVVCKEAGEKRHKQLVRYLGCCAPSRKTGVQNKMLGHQPQLSQGA